MKCFKANGSRILIQAAAGSASEHFSGWKCFRASMSKSAPKAPPPPLPGPPPIMLACDIVNAFTGEVIARWEGHEEALAGAMAAGICPWLPGTWNVLTRDGLRLAAADAQINDLYITVSGRRVLRVVHNPPTS